MKYHFKPLLIVSGILFMASCAESPSLKETIDLHEEDKQLIATISFQFNTLLRQKTTINFIKTAMQQDDKASFIADYLSPQFNGDQKELAFKIATHLFSPKPASDLSKRIKEDSFFVIPAVVAQLADQLTDNIKNAIIDANNKGQSIDELTTALKLVIADFKKEVQLNTSLTTDEAKALIGFAEFENNTIGELVNVANALYNNSGSKIQGWLSKLVAVLVTAVVVAVVVVAVVATAGAAAIALSTFAAMTAASWFGTAVAVGAVVGVVAGGAIGYDQVVQHNNYFTEFDPTNVGGGFLDWEPCYANPGAWACI